MKDEEFENYVRDCYLKILKREPDHDGLLNYVNALKSGKITMDELENKFLNSKEYLLLSKINSTISPKNNLSDEEWMKQDWDKRAQSDAKFFIMTVKDQKEEEFWESGKKDCNKILGKESHRFDWICNGKNPNELRVLEIGCGIGRILIPMSSIFKEVIGVDVSKKMIELSKQYVDKIPNCHTYENSGSDLSLFEEDYFDFCYSYIVFQHIPKKEIIENYIKEVSRVLKTGGIFRFQVKGDLVKNVFGKFETWHGYNFTHEEIHKIANENNFEILEESERKIYYRLTFKSKK